MIDAKTHVPIYWNIISYEKRRIIHLAVISPLDVIEGQMLLFPAQNPGIFAFCTEDSSGKQEKGHSRVANWYEAV